MSAVVDIFLIMFGFVELLLRITVLLALICTFIWLIWLVSGTSMDPVMNLLRPVLWDLLRLRLGAAR